MAITRQLQAATAYVAVGSNMGDRALSIQRALNQLPQEGVNVEDASSIIETEAIGAPKGQEHLRYLNGVVAVRTFLPPHRLLAVLLRIEDKLGRDREHEPRYGARPIDLDLVLYEDVVIDEPGLCVPHPRMHQRSFVLEPLAQIAPDARHPILNKTATELLADVRAAESATDR